MNYEDYLKDALEMVLAWDLPEEELADAVTDQARLMAGLPPDEIRPRQAEQSFTSTFCLPSLPLSQLTPAEQKPSA